MLLFLHSRKNVLENFPLKLCYKEEQEKEMKGKQGSTSKAQTFPNNYLFLRY